MRPAIRINYKKQPALPRPRCWFTGIVYSLGIWVLMVAWIYPGIWAYTQFDPLDTWPYVLTYGGGLGVGVTLAWIGIRLQRARLILVGVVLSLVLPFWCTGLMLPINQWCDHSVPVRYFSKIIKFKKVQQGAGQLCRLVLAKRWL